MAPYAFVSSPIYAVVCSKLILRRRDVRIHQRLKPCDDVGGSVFFSCAFFGVHWISLLLFGEAISCVEVIQVQENGLVQVLSARPFVPEGQSSIPRCDFKSLFRLFPFRVSTCSFKQLWTHVKRDTDEERVGILGAANRRPQVCQLGAVTSYGPLPFSTR